MKTRLYFLIILIGSIAGIAISQITQSGAQRNIGVGFDQLVTGYGAVNLGWNNTNSGNHSITIGYGNIANYSNSIVIGRNRASTAANQIVIGDSSQGAVFTGPLYSHGGAQFTIGDAGPVLLNIDTGEERVYIQGIDGNIAHLFNTNGSYVGAFGQFTIDADGTVTITNSSGGIGGLGNLRVGNASLQNGSAYLFDLHIGSLGALAMDSGRVIYPTALHFIDYADLQPVCGKTNLVSGTQTVATQRVLSTSQIHITTDSMGTTVGIPYVHSRTPGTSFVITNTGGTSCTSSVSWFIVEHGF